MLAHAMTTTAALVVLSLVSKVLLESHESTAAALELLRQATHWRDVAAQEADVALQLQHAATAAALLTAARTVVRDVDLERASGTDVPRLARSLTRQLARARQSARGGGGAPERGR
jgi:hypothetical protein